MVAQLTTTPSILPQQPQQEVFLPGTPVDIFIAASQPEGKKVWVTGYRISESKKPRHKKMAFAKMLNPDTEEFERCYAVQSGSKVFPVPRSLVRRSGYKTGDLWEFRYCNQSVVLEGYVVSDASDKADLEALESFGLDEQLPEEED